MHSGREDFRSATLDFANENDIYELQSSYDIRVIFDLRSASEHTKKQSSSTRIPVILLPAVEALDETIIGRYFYKLPDDAPAAYAELYLYICNQSTAAFQTMFKYIRNHPRSPFLVHCELGKDRTGVFIALLLFALGVSEADITRDYAISHKGLQILAPERKSKLLKSDFMRDISPSPIALEKHFTASPHFMRKFLSRLKDSYGSGQGYMKSIGFNITDIDMIKTNMTREV